MQLASPISDHTGYLPPGRGDISTFAPSELEFDLATTERWKAELTTSAANGASFVQKK